MQPPAQKFVPRLARSEARRLLSWSPIVINLEG
jgi:hypothetical protein